MPEDVDDPFGDLEDTIDDGSTDQDSASTPDSSDQAADSQDEAGGPAFAFGATTQRPLYAREDAWEAFDDVLLDVEVALREHDIRDATKSEMHDAALRVLADEAEAVAEQIAAARDE